LVIMPNLSLNGTPIPFEPGATILEAARTAGVDIPTLCWYPRLPIVFREAAANLLTNPQLDPYARIAAFKISAVRIEPVHLPAVV
jgi:predicted molibdopterin-dependent oxidoreductase YjgC